MYFITDKITDLRSLTAKRIREIVASAEVFNVLATEFGERNVWGWDRSSWLAFSLSARRLAIAGFDDRNDFDLVNLASIDVVVSTADIEEEEEEMEKQGINQSANDAEIIGRIFKRRCEERDARVIVMDSNQSVFEWKDPWEKRILEVVKSLKISTSH